MVCRWCGHDGPHLVTPGRDSPELAEGSPHRNARVDCTSCGHHLHWFPRWVNVDMKEYRRDVASVAQVLSDAIDFAGPEAVRDLLVEGINLRPT